MPLVYGYRKYIKSGYYLEATINVEFFKYKGSLVSPLKLWNLWSFNNYIAKERALKRGFDCTVYLKR